MPDTIVKVENLSKCYHLDKFQGESFTEAIGNYIDSLSPNRRANREEYLFWALKSVSFELQQGDSLGIFGSNGSGKSTLLKIISEITPPTDGQIELHGKVASVLEVGTGFHPDLSGRQNIFLSAGMYGMRDREIKDKLDDIIAFSEIGSFIDTPVKHYSSGMYVRLAFSLIIHVSADILLFDEVISVGDAAFKLKSLNKIRELEKQGKTIVIVTHNLGEIMNICNKAIVLEQGEVKGFGSPDELIAKYLEEAHEQAVVPDSESSETAKDSKKERAKNFKVWESLDSAPGNATGRVEKFSAKAKGKELSDKISMEDTIEVDIQFQKLTPDNTADVGFTLYDNAGNNVFASTSVLSHDVLTAENEGAYRARCEIPANYLNSGTFTMNVFMVENGEKVYRSVPDVIFFKVHPGQGEAAKKWAGRFPGPLRPLLNWEISTMEDVANIN